ncbi:MAG: hypothetical protein M0R03_03315 [Novosphingobium sp.]|nr:hypothetical protein [Novosphingobium sp.]
MKADTVVRLQCLAIDAGVGRIGLDQFDHHTPAVSQRPFDERARRTRRSEIGRVEFLETRHAVALPEHVHSRAKIAGHITKLEKLALCGRRNHMSGILLDVIAVGISFEQWGNRR